MSISPRRGVIPRVKSLILKDSISELCLSPPMLIGEKDTARPLVRRRKAVDTVKRCNTCKQVLPVLPPAPIVGNIVEVISCGALAVVVSVDRHFVPIHYREPEEEYYVTAVALTSGANSFIFRGFEGNWHRSSLRIVHGHIHVDRGSTQSADRTDAY